MYHLAASTAFNHTELLSIWEASVRATHHFLAAADLDFFRALINDNQLFRQVAITTATNEAGEVIAFSGVSGNNLEMLFVHPDHIGKGAGKQLLMHALARQNITRVDVNEQNHLEWMKP